MLALIFIPAGTFQYWQGWLCGRFYYLLRCLHGVSGKARSGIAETTHRSRHLSQKEFTQKVVMALLFAAFIALVVLPRLMSASAGR